MAGSRSTARLGERAAAHFRLRTRLGLSALLASALAASVVWFAVDRHMVPRVEARFEKETAQILQSSVVAWSEYWSNVTAARVQAVSGWLRSEADHELSTTEVEGDDEARTRGPATGSRHLPGSGLPHKYFAYASHFARISGSELIFVDRRDTDPEWYLSSGIPASDRESFEEILERRADVDASSGILSPRGLGSGRIVLLEGDSSRPRLYLVSKAFTIAHWGDIAAVRPMNAATLSPIRWRTGAHVVVLDQGRAIASSFFDGHSVVELPVMTDLEAEFLLRTLAEKSTWDPKESTIGATSTWLASTRSGDVDGVPTVRRYFRSIEGWSKGRTIIPTKDLDMLVPYVRTAIPTPREPEAPSPFGLFLPRLEELAKDGVEGDDTSSNPERFDQFVVLASNFPPGLGGAPELAETVIAGWNASETAKLREVLDWRDVESVDPLNLWEANRDSLESFAGKLGVADPAAVAKALEPHLGPAGRKYSSDDILAAAGVESDDAEMLAGLLYREDPATWESVRALRKYLLEDGVVVAVGASRYSVATEEIDEYTKMRIGVLVDRAAFQEEVKSLRVAAIGGVIVVFLFVFVVLYLVGGTITGPVHRVEEAMGMVEQGKLDAWLPVFGRDEFSRIAVRFNQMTKGLIDKARLERSFRRYVPDAIVRQAAERGQVAELGGELVTATIFFADVRGFSKASTLMPAADLVRLLNTYFQIFIDEIRASGGTVDKFIGDAVLAIWNTPEPIDDFAGRAVRTAAQIQERILAMNRERQARGDFLVYFGIGISTGEVLAGHVGSEDRADWTVIGVDVNLAQRISAVAWPYRVLVSENTVKAMRPREAERLAFREIEKLQLKGFDEPVKVQGLLWYKGHSGPLIDPEPSVKWHHVDGVEKKGPFTLEELVLVHGFTGDSLVARGDSPPLPWKKHAVKLRVWAVKISEGTRGLYTLDEIVSFPGNAPGTLVQLVTGSNPWLTIEEARALLKEV